MIRPIISQLRPEHLGGLSKLLIACDMAYASDWTWNPDATLVAVHDDTVVGFVAFWHDGQPYAWVDTLCVHPDYRYQGVGPHLCWAVEGILRQRGVKAIRCALETDMVENGLRVKDGLTLRDNMKKYGFHSCDPHVVMEKFYEGA